MKRALCLGFCVVQFCLLTTLCHADPRKDFLKMIDRPRVPLAAQWKDPDATAADAIHPFSYSTEANQRVPGIMMGLGSGKRPAVIVLHGTGGTKSDELPMLRKLIAKGFVAIAIDGRYHGERTKAGKGSAEYEDAIVHAYYENDASHAEHPFFYDTVWDVMRLVDYLETRSDIDGSRIGLMGISKGGIETYLTAAVDTRIAASVPCIGVQSFKWALDNDNWHGRINTIKNAFATITKQAMVEKPDSAFVQKFYDKVVPGIYSEFDGPAMLAITAPRPVLSINSDSDDHTPLPGVKIAAEAAKKAYHEAGADDHFVLRIQEKTGHHVNPDSEDAAVDWFVKWLKP